MSFSPVILIIFILVAVVLTLFLLLYFKKVQTPSAIGVTKNQPASLPPIKPESSPWLIKSKTFPLDPILPPPNGQYCPICQLYTFGGSVAQMGKPILRDLPGCISDHTCIAAECPENKSSYPVCVWPDQVFAFYGSHLCGPAQIPNAAGTCMTQNGQAVPPGYVESYYDSCGTTQSCNKTSPNMTMDLLVINWDYGEITPTNINPLSKFFCLENKPVPDPVPVDFSAFTWEICDIGKNLEPSQVWVITRYTYDTITLSPDPAGFLMSIMNRNTGEYLMPKTFTPADVPGWVLTNIPAGDKTLELDFYQAPTGQTYPGVWWALYTHGMYPPYIDFPCPGQSSYQCIPAVQLVFIPDYTLVPSYLLPSQLINYLMASYSLNVIVNRDDLNGNFVDNGNGTWTMNLNTVGPQTLGTNGVLRKFFIPRNLTNPNWTQPPVTVNTFFMEYSQYPNYVKAANYHFPDPT